MLKDLFLIKPRQLPWVFLILLSGISIFFVAQFGIALIVYIVLTAFGKTPDEIEATYGSESYWPQVLIYFLIYGSVVLLLFQVLKLWDRITVKKISKTSKTTTAATTPKSQQQNQQNLSRKIQLRQHIRYLMLDNIPSWKQFFEVFLIYGLYIITMIFVSMIVQLSGAVNVSQSQDLGVSPPTEPLSIIAVMIIFIVLPPVAEEILFRGYLFRKLREYAPIGLSVILTSILFGMAHLEYGNLNWIAAIDTFVFSLYLIFVSQKHKSLYSAIMLHVLKNSLALAFFVWGVQAVTMLKP